MLQANVTKEGAQEASRKKPTIELLTQAIRYLVGKLEIGDRESFYELFPDLKQ